MRIVHAASEMFPWLKTGGLADVVAALSGALADNGHDVAVFLPGYRSVLDKAVPAGAARSHQLKIEMGDAFLAADIYTLSPRPRLTLHLVCREEFFDRRQPYWTGERDYDDNDARFIFFQKAAVEVLRLTDFKADIVHCHDWQTGLLPIFLRDAERRHSVTLALKTVFTIHNIAYQGVFPKKSFPLTNLPEEMLTIDGIEYYDQLSMLKGGVLFADLVTTVSPQYAHEIQTPEFGHGMDGVIRTRVDDLHGLINGVDTAVWNPATDQSLPARFNADDLTGKETCRAKLLREFGWSAKFKGPIFAMISRMTPAKGHDFVLAAIPFFTEENCRLVVLGSGEKKYEVEFMELSVKHRDKIGVSVRLDEAMSHLIEAAADFFLMPSLFEPCGLNQMYSLNYGTIPLVSRVGGLVDTVKDIDEHPEDGTGLMFAPKQEEFDAALRRALKLYADKPRLAAVRGRGMRQDFSWKKAVEAYERLYHAAL